MQSGRKLLVLILLFSLMTGCAAAGSNCTQDHSASTVDNTEQESNSVLVTLYEGNDAGTGLTASVTRLSELTGAALTDALTAIGAIPARTQCLHCSSGVMEDGTVRLSLDLSVDFEEGVRVMGSAGETLILASLVNTFLEAFEADALELTIDGESLETNHNLYDSLFSAYTFPQAEA